MNGKIRGHLEFEINGWYNWGNWFNVNQKVVDKCFEDFEGMYVQNTHDAAWKGTITVKKNGIEVPLTCAGCRGIPFENVNGNDIVVDGNDDSWDEAPTLCLHGTRCYLQLYRKEGNIIFYFVDIEYYLLL